MSGETKSDNSVANTTQEGSIGYVSTSDAKYQAIPADSRAAPAPIDPSSKSRRRAGTRTMRSGLELIAVHSALCSQQDLLHLGTRCLSRMLPIGWMELNESELNHGRYGEAEWRRVGRSGDNRPE